MHSGATPIQRRALMLLTLGFSCDVRWPTSSGRCRRSTAAIFRAASRTSSTCRATSGSRPPRANSCAARSADDAPPARSVAALMQGMPYIAMMMSFLVLVYVESSTAASPVNTMTVIIFVLTSLVMVRQGVLSRDDALLRERRAADIVEARYASLIKNASDVIMITDADGQLRFASPAAERTFAIHPDDLVGRNLLDLWADGDRERLAAFLAEVAATRGRVVGPIELRGRDRRPAQHARVRRQQPDGRPGDRRAGAEFPRRERAQGAGGAVAQAGVPRPADAARQPQPVLEPRRARAGAGASLAAARGRHVPRPRQLQERQRLARPRRRRSPAAGGGAAAGQVDPAVRHRGAPRRRRVRHPAGRHPQRDGRRAHRHADHRGVQPPAAARRPGNRRVRQHRRGLLATGRRRRTDCCATPTSPCTTRRRPARRASCCSSRTCRNSCTIACDWSRTSTWRWPRRVLRRVPARRRPDEPRVARRRSAGALEPPAAGHRHARRLHLDRRGIGPDRRTRPARPARRVHAGPRVERLGRRPATACASRSTSPAATCSRETWSRTCATRSRSPASSPATW